MPKVALLTASLVEISGVLHFIKIMAGCIKLGGIKLVTVLHRSSIMDEFHSCFSTLLLFCSFFSLARKVPLF